MKPRVPYVHILPHSTLLKSAYLCCITKKHTETCEDPEVNGKTVFNTSGLLSGSASLILEWRQEEEMHYKKK
jgi:hypothetical protein